MTELELLERALTEPYGLSVSTESLHLVRMRLYKSRRLRPEFEQLTITISPIAPDAVWIVRKEHYE